VTDRFAADGDAAFREEVLDIAVTEVESIVEPDGVGNDVSWKSVSLVDTHEPILPISAT